MLVALERFVKNEEEKKESRIKELFVQLWCASATMCLCVFVSFCHVLVLCSSVSFVERDVERGTCAIHV